MALRGTGRPRGHWVVLQAELTAQRWGAWAPPRGGDLRALGRRGGAVSRKREQTEYPERGAAVCLCLRPGISGDRCALGLGEVPEVSAVEEASAACRPLLSPPPGAPLKGPRPQGEKGTEALRGEFPSSMGAPHHQSRPPTPASV